MVSEPRGQRGLSIPRSRNAEIAGAKVSFRPLLVFYKPAQYEVCHWSLQAHPEVGYVVFNCIIVSSLDIYA